MLNSSSWSMRNGPDAKGIAPAPPICGVKKRAAPLEKTMSAENPCKFSKLTRPAYPGILDRSHSIGKVRRHDRHFAGTDCVAHRRRESPRILIGAGGVERFFNVKIDVVRLPSPDDTAASDTRRVLLRYSARLIARILLASTLRKTTGSLTRPEASRLTGCCRQNRFAAGVAARRLTCCGQFS